MSNLAEKVKADALEAQKFSRKHLVLELDFTEPGVQELEATVDSLEFAIPGGLSDENVKMLTRIWGAYIGESLRRARGGEWVEQEGKLALASDKATTYPQEQVRRRLTEGPEHNLVEYFQQTKQQL